MTSGKDYHLSLQISHLSNGLRVVSENRPNLETLSIGFFVDVGSRHETEAVNGITHCLEHMLFKGTKKRSARDIAFEIEAVGGHMNAYTSRDNTSYYARVLKEDRLLALDMLSDIILNSVFDEGELEREKEVICQEIGQSLDTPDDIIFDHLQGTAFQGQALGRPILGPVETVRRLSRSDLCAFLRERYHAGSLILVAVGNLDHEQLVIDAEERLGGLAFLQGKEAEKASFTGGYYRETKPLEQLHVTLGFEGFSFSDPDYYALQIYSTLLGGGMSSRLFQKLREELGLAYSVYSFASSHHDTGLLGVYMGTGPDMIEGILPLIRREMEEMTCKVSEEERALGLAQMKAGILMSLESTSGRMEQLGRHMLIHNRILSTQELVGALEAVQVKDIQRVAERLLSGPHALAALGGKAVADLSF